MALRAFHDHYGAPCLDLPSKEDSLSSVRASHYLLGVENENKADTEAAMSSVGGFLFLHTLSSNCLVTTLLTPLNPSVLPHLSALHN